MRIDYSLFNIPWKRRASVAVFGVAYDSTSSLNKGSVAFPASVRLASHGIEWDIDFDASDFGDLLPRTPPDIMLKDVEEFMDELWSMGFRRFFVMGGNHSITIPVVRFLSEKGLKNYVQFDAHADFRQEFTGTEYSYACTLRRVSEFVKDVSLIGVRSIAEEEREVLDSVRVIEGKDLCHKKEEVRNIVKNADYVSIDMDALRGASTSNPEPHWQIELGFLLESLDGPKTAVDVVEGVPERVLGDPTATMAALIARKALPLLSQARP